MKFQLSTLSTLCALSLAKAKATEERSEKQILGTNGIKNDAFVPTKILRNRHAQQEANLGVGKVLTNVKNTAGGTRESSSKGRLEDQAVEDPSELVGDLGILDIGRQLQGPGSDDTVPNDDDPTPAPAASLDCEEYCAQFGERPLIPQNDKSFQSKVWGYLFPNYDPNNPPPIRNRNDNDSDRLLETQINPYGGVPIGCWNTSQITEMTSAFDAPVSYIVPFDDDSSPVDFLNPFNKRLCWDTKQVTNMENMFNRCDQFNQPLDSFDTSLVTSMARMFNDAIQFNQPLSSFDTSAVTDMSSMFANPNPRSSRGVGQFNQPLNSFDTSAVTDMSSMFFNTLFNQPLDSFDTSSVTTMASMFGNDKYSSYPLSLGFNQPLNSWDTSAVKDMSLMFSYARGFNQPLAFDTSSVETMLEMFEGASQFDNTVDFNTSRVKQMRSMFRRAGQFNQPVSNFDTSSVTNMSSMFNGAGNFNQPVPFDTSKVESYGFSSMFSGASSFNQNLDTWDTSSVTSISSMFRDAISFDQSLSSFDTPRVKSMRKMFDGATAFNQDLSNFNTEKVEHMGGMFADAINFNQPLTNFKTSEVYNMEAMFSGALAFNQPLDNFDTFNVRDFNSMFEGAVVFNQPLEGAFDTRTADETTAMFRNAKAFNQPLDSWNLAGVSRLERMFEGATSFNQCIPSWQQRFIFADGIPSSIRVPRIRDIFKGSACPNQSDPTLTESPWCQTTETCSAPSCNDELEFDDEPNSSNNSGNPQPECKDDESFQKKNKNCKDYLKKGNLEKKCNKKYRKKKIFDLCKKTCAQVGLGDCAVECDAEDDESFSYNDKNCDDYLAKNAKTKCDKTRNGKKVFEWCPKTCGEKANLGECAPGTTTGQPTSSPQNDNVCPDKCKDSTVRFDLPFESFSPSNASCITAFRNWVTNSNRVRLCSRAEIRDRESGETRPYSDECPESCGKLGYGRCAAAFNN